MAGEKGAAQDLIDAQRYATLEDYGGDVDSYVEELLEIADESGMTMRPSFSRDDLAFWLTYYLTD